MAHARFLTRVTRPLSPAILATCAAVGALTSGCAAFGEREVERSTALSTFDEVWTTVRDTHFDPDLNGVDWDAVRDELRPQAANARTDDELRGVINAMLGRLGQSHFGMMSRESLPSLDGAAGDGDGDKDTPEALAGDAGFDVRIREGQVLVSSVREGGPADEAGVQRGWILAELNGDDLEARVERALSHADEERYAVMGLTNGLIQGLIGPVGSRLPLRFLDEEGNDVEVEIERGERDVIAHDFGTNLPTFYLHFEDEIIERDGKRIGRIHFTNWFLPMQGKIDAAVDRMRDCDGIIIDLRGNGGGAGAMVMGTAGHFFNERTKLGVSTSRNNTMIINALPRKVNAANERVEPYAGPLAVLTDELTGSASEMFAGGMQSTGRATVFGETSAGAVLPATTRSLANGDGLIFAMGDYVTATGESLEGVGVVPDVEVPLTQAGLLEQGDPTLDAAIQWITGGARP